MQAVQLHACPIAKTCRCSGDALVTMACFHSLEPRDKLCRQGNHMTDGEETMQATGQALPDM